MEIKNKILVISSILFTLVYGESFAKANVPAADKYKTKGPIEITSDSLEILQQKNKAIFTGHVVAIQGDVRIKSERMTVFYKENQNKTAKKDSKGKKNISPNDVVGEKNSIEKIIVEKNVFLTTSEETARGASGIYDVANQKIYLNDNVVLTRDKNVLKGNKLVYDFATGKSELKAAETGKSKQRVKALFTNNGDNKDKNKK